MMMKIITSSILLLTLIFFSCLIIINVNAQVTITGGVINGGVNISAISPPATNSASQFQNTALAEPSVTHFLMFDTPSYAPIYDLVTGLYLPVPPGMTMQQPGAFLNSPTVTAATTTGFAMPLWSTNTLSLEYTQPWSMEFLINPNGLVHSDASDAYYLFSKLTSTFAGYGVILANAPGGKNATTRDTAIVPSETRLVVDSLIYDGTEGWNVANTDAITNSEWQHVVVTYVYSNSLPYFRVWINGAPSQMTTNQYSGPVPTTILNNITPTILGSTNSGAKNFIGSVQCVATYNTNLSPEKIVQHYQAWTGQPTNWNNSFLPSPFSAQDWVDTTGNPLQLLCMYPFWVAASNSYFVMGMIMTNTDYQSTAFSPDFDMTNTAYVCYQTPNLLPGTYTNLGTALDLTYMTAYNLQASVRLSILPNPISGYIAWARQINQTNTTAYNFTVIATSTVPQGPYSVVVSNYNPNAKAAGDCNLFQDTSGAQYFAYATYVPQSLWVTAISANGLSSSGSATLVSSSPVNGGYLEGVTMIKLGSTYYYIASYQEYYQSLPRAGSLGMADIFYYTCTSSTPLGPWTFGGSIYANVSNPYGTPFECQSSVAFQPNNSTNFYLISDNWANGYLARSSVVIQLLTFPTSTTLAVAGSTNLLCTFQ